MTDLNASCFILIIQIYMVIHCFITLNLYKILLYMPEISKLTDETQLDNSGNSF